MLFFSSSSHLLHRQSASKIPQEPEALNLLESPSCRLRIHAHTEQPTAKEELSPLLSTQTQKPSERCRIKFCAALKSLHPSAFPFPGLCWVSRQTLVRFACTQPVPGSAGKRSSSTSTAEERPEDNLKQRERQLLFVVFFLVQGFTLHAEMWPCKPPGPGNRETESGRNRNSPLEGWLLTLFCARTDWGAEARVGTRALQAAILRRVMKTHSGL